jgi:hypothetical protein
MRVGIVTLLIFLSSNVVHAGDFTPEWVAFSKDLEVKQREQEGPPNIQVDESMQVECTTNAHCRSLQICFQHRCITKTQRQTIQTNARNLIEPGGFLTAFGGLNTIIGGALLGASLNEPDDTCNDDECGEEWFDYGPVMKTITGITFLSIGGTMFITGVVLLSVGLAKRRKMERNKLAFEIHTKHGKLTLEPAIAAGENGGVFGLSGRF